MKAKKDIKYFIKQVRKENDRLNLNFTEHNILSNAKENYKNYIEFQKIYKAVLEDIEKRKICPFKEVVNNLSYWTFIEECDIREMNTDQKIKHYKYKIHKIKQKLRYIENYKLYGLRECENCTKNYRKPCEKGLLDKSMKIVLKDCEIKLRGIEL